MEWLLLCCWYYITHNYKRRLETLPKTNTNDSINYILIMAQKNKIFTFFIGFFLYYRFYLKTKYLFIQDFLLQRIFNRQWEMSSMTMMMTSEGSLKSIIFISLLKSLTLTTFYLLTFWECIFKVIIILLAFAGNSTHVYIGFCAK